MVCYTTESYTGSLMLKSTEGLFNEDKHQHQKINNRTSTTTVYYDIDSDFDSSIELDEYDVYDELEERGLYSVGDSCLGSDTEMDQEEFTSMIDDMSDSHCLPSHSLLSSISDDDDDDDDDESIDYFDLEEAAELAGIPFPHSLLQQSSSTSTSTPTPTPSSSSCSLLSCELTSMMTRHSNHNELFDGRYHHHQTASLSISNNSVVSIQMEHEPAMSTSKMATITHPHPSLLTSSSSTAASSAAITYRRNVALGCLSPPQSPDLSMDANSNTIEHSLQQQMFKYNNDESDYSSAYDDHHHHHHYHLSDYSNNESHGDGYAGDAWQTWGNPESSEVNRDWINSLLNESFQSSSQSYTTTTIDGDDDRYSPNDDWIYGAYGITKNQ